MAQAVATIIVSVPPNYVIPGVGIGQSIQITANGVITGFNPNENTVTVQVTYDADLNVVAPVTVPVEPQGVGAGGGV